MNVLEIETRARPGENKLDVATVPSPIGVIRLFATGEALVAVRLPGSDPVTAASRERKTPVLDEAVGQMKAYFAGELRSFTIPVAFSGSPFEGTPFQTDVWRGLLKIPYGESRSYAWLAESIGRPGAYRAVGAANGRNPLAIVVPCHRVIGADGSLTGYGGGLEAKQWLLDHEAAQVDLFA